MCVQANLHISRSIELMFESVERRAAEFMKALKHLSSKKRFLQFEDEKTEGAHNLDYKIMEMKDEVSEESVIQKILQY